MNSPASEFETTSTPCPPLDPRRRVANSSVREDAIRESSSYQSRATPCDFGSARRRKDLGAEVPG